MRIPAPIAEATPSSTGTTLRTPAGLIVERPLRDLMSALHRMIERTPPELASDIFDEGITLSGGGAQLFGLDGVISDQLKIRTTLADEPDLCVAHGLSELIDDEERYENIDLVSGSRSDLLGDD